jgi:uncharacterized small protein (DUF1192 family)
VCKTQTFEVMVAALKKADEALVAAEADRIKAELAKKKAKPAAKLKLDKGDKK